ncbi:MAG: putative quinol monooxygenase [Tepidisphaeraceae bacterium]
MAKVTVIARALALPGKEKELKEVLRSMLAPTHAEPGEKVYDLYQSDTAGRFYFFEVWQSQAAFDHHANTPHFKALGAKLDGLIAEPIELNFVTAVA